LTLPVVIYIWRQRGKNPASAGEEPRIPNEPRPIDSPKTCGCLGFKNPGKWICGESFKVECPTSYFVNRARFTAGGCHQLLPDYFLWQKLCFRCVSQYPISL
jgi:hypothetical protein